MPCSPDFIEYLIEQFSPAGTITTVRMFGEYGLYLDGKIIGLVCDNQFFLKKTQAAADMLGENALIGYPYTGSRGMYVFDSLDDQDFVCSLLRASWEELPFPKPKKPRGRKA
ncbi:MAG: TfoX/Sxy family protein [Anaerolineaceae bacterium]|jgi:TfoX/Sxy family transcriptional regulator of competence genes|nr:TfoX/Sxy family protein [Anaerolineaceae bacterium]